MKVRLLNQFGAGSEAPTGRLAGELAGFLQAAGHHAVVISSDPSYAVRRTGWRRWAHECRSHAILFFSVLAAGRADAVIALTSPVCLPVTARIAALLVGARLYLWNMDLYPDLAVALGELRPGPLATFLHALMRSAYASAARVVALDEDMREYLQNEYGVDSAIVSPWPPELPWPSVPPVRAGDTRTWLYSGNLGQAHDIRTLLEIQKLIEDAHIPFQLILQGSGAQWAPSQKIATQLQLKNVTWRAPVPESELTRSLLSADVLVVTRKPGMKGLIWPSKLALAQFSGVPVLWVGDTNSHTARALLKDSRNGTFSPDQKNEVFRWLQARSLGPDDSLPPTPTAVSRQENRERWLTILAGKAIPS